MKKIWLAALIVILTAGCNQQPALQGKQQIKAVSATKKQYTCIMHPEVLTNKPGVCPKCGMDLVEKEK